MQMTAWGACSRADLAYPGPMSSEIARGCPARGGKGSPASVGRALLLDVLREVA